MEKYYMAEYALSDSVLSPIGQAQTLEDILKIALPVRTKMKVKYTFGGGEEEDFFNYYDEKYERHYNYNSGVISFFYNGVFYSIPSSSKVRKILSESGFEQDDRMYVLCNMTPAEPNDKYWEKLINESDGLNAIEAVEEIKGLCNKPFERKDGKVVEEVSEESRARSFRIPGNGIKVTHFGKEEVYTPFVGVNSTQGYVTNTEYLGTYEINNGTMVYYTPSGTYVTRSEKAIHEVYNKYQGKSSFVPFSNGELPVDVVEERMLDDIFMSDEAYERKHSNNVNDIKKEIREEKSRMMMEQQKELFQLRKKLAEAQRRITELTGESFEDALTAKKQSL